MSTPTPADLLQLALGVFPPLPTIVEVLSADGGGFPLRIADREDELLHAYGPRTQMRKELQLLARITDPAAAATRSSSRWPRSSTTRPPMRSCT